MDVAVQCKFAGCYKLDEARTEFCISTGTKNNIGIRESQHFVDLGNQIVLLLLVLTSY